MLGSGSDSAMDGTGLGVEGARVIKLADMFRIKGGDVSECIP